MILKIAAALGILACIYAGVKLLLEVTQAEDKVVTVEMNGSHKLTLHHTTTIAQPIYFCVNCGEVNPWSICTGVKEETGANCTPVFKKHKLSRTYSLHCTRHDCWTNNAYFCREWRKSFKPK